MDQIFLRSHTIRHSACGVSGESEQNYVARSVRCKETVVPGFLFSSRLLLADGGHNWRAAVFIEVRPRLVGLLVTFCFLLVVELEELWGRLFQGSFCLHVFQSFESRQLQSPSVLASLFQCLKLLLSAWSLLLFGNRNKSWLSFCGTPSSSGFRVHFWVSSSFRTLFLFCSGQLRQVDRSLYLPLLGTCWTSRLY